MFASDSGKSQFDFHFVRKGSVWRRKNHVFFPLPPPPPVCYVQPLYRAKGGSWGFKTALVNEEKYSFWTIFDFYVPSTLQHSRFSIWRGMTVRVIIQEPHPPFPYKTVAFNVVQPYEPVSYLESGLKCPILPLQNITLNVLTRLFFCRGCSLSPSRKAIYIARGSIPPLVPLGRLFLDVACTCPLTLFF